MMDKFDLSTPEGKEGHLKHLLDNMTQKAGTVFSSFHQQLIDTDRGFYLILGLDGTINQVSSNIRELLGINPGEVIGTRLDKFISLKAIQKTVDEVNRQGFAMKEVQFQGLDFIALTWLMPGGTAFGEYLIRKGATR